MEFTNIGRILSKHYRDIGEDVSESDIVEWAGEALEFLEVPPLKEEALAFLEVRDYHAPVPPHMHDVIHIARYDGGHFDCPNRVIAEIGTPKCRCCDCDNNIIEDGQMGVPAPYFNLSYEYQPFVKSSFYHSHFTPVRLTDNTFFKSGINCDEDGNGIFIGDTDSYAIVGGYGTDRVLRFSFRNGSVAVAYYRNVLDKDTGYPLIPDDIRCITAIEYYIQWKMAEQKSWNGEEGFQRLAADKYQLWNKYCKQAIDWMKMPQTEDEIWELIEANHRLIPEGSGRFYNFFGNFKYLKHGGKRG